MFEWIRHSQPVWLTKSNRGKGRLKFSKTKSKWNVLEENSSMKWRVLFWTPHSQGCTEYQPTVRAPFSMTSALSSRVRHRLFIWTIFSNSRKLITTSKWIYVSPKNWQNHFFASSLIFTIGPRDRKINVTFVDSDCICTRRNAIAALCQCCWVCFCWAVDFLLQFASKCTAQWPRVGREDAMKIAIPVIDLPNSHKIWLN